MYAAIGGIEFHVPEKRLTNADLAREFPEWSVDKIEEKTGIEERRIAGPEECSSDLGIAAAQKLFSSGACTPEEIDYILFCTQSPDHFLPTTACLMQKRLGLPTTAGALDFNLGCSGYVYGLGLAKALIETGQAKKLLLVTSETYSKFIHPSDKTVRTLFGDAGAATLVHAVPGTNPFIGPFIYGTDGGGASNLMVPAGGMRCPPVPSEEAVPDSDGNLRAKSNLYMNGPEIFAFTLDAVPKSVAGLLSRSNKTMEEIDLFVFHQANRYMLEHLRKRMGIPREKFFVSLRQFGNTVSCTIPIALKQAEQEGRLREGARVMLVGFGVGYSWASTLAQWTIPTAR